MIKFTDVCKAYVRYWFVILICVVLCLGVVMAVVPKEKTITAESTIVVRGTEEVTEKNEFISDAYAASVIKEMAVRIAHKHFAEMLRENLDESLKTKYNEDALRKGISVTAKKDDRFFTLAFNSTSEADAIAIVNAATDLAVKEYSTVEGSKARLQPLYDVETHVKNSKMAVYAVIGVLIGLVLGIVVVTFFVVFNPLVENKDLLEKETGIKVLSSLDKR